MSPRLRTFFLLASLAGLGALLLRGLAGLPAFGHYPGPYGDQVNALTVPERQSASAVTAVVFDFRGIDTLGEEFILFAAVTGVSLLLREAHAGDDPSANKREEDAVPNRTLADPADAVRAASLAMAGLTFVFGVYIVLHGHISPGGGFGGGVILAGVWQLLYVAGGFEHLRRLGAKERVEVIEAIGAGAYAVIGLAPLMAGAAYLQNIFPLGTSGDLLSAGMIPVINAVVGIEVAAAFVLLLVEFTEETQKVEQWNKS